MAEDKDKGRKLRPKERRTYSDLDIDEDDIEGRRTFSLEEKLSSTKYSKSFVKELTSADVNLKYFQENGFTSPIFIKEKSGLGMRMPSQNFTVADVKSGVGSRRVLDVMDVTTQKAMEMTMKEWVKYYENPQKDRLLNVISLEFSHTKLDNYVEQPAVVRQLDWVDNVWPQHLKDCQTESTNIIQRMKYPKVQKYCLMSVRGCYTDFHIDMSGTSVWYHILRGAKVFWLIPPTDQNLELYENWTLSGKQGDMFFADQVEGCQRINLEAGNTFFIPTGWIHAVYTPVDSLVFGGNFLHSLNIPMQLRIWDVEEKTHVPHKFRYPFLQEIHWYVLDRYLTCVSDRSHREKSNYELQEEKENKMKTESAAESADDKGETRPGSSMEEHSLERSPVDENNYVNSPKPFLPESPPSPSTLQSGSPKVAQSPVAKLENYSEGVKPEDPSKGYMNPSDLIKPVSVKLENCLLMPARSLTPSSLTQKPYAHLNAYEIEGLHKAITWLLKFPVAKRQVPRDIPDIDGLAADIEIMLKAHAGDDQRLACSGENIIAWPPRTVKAKMRTYTYPRVSGPKSSKSKDKDSGVSRRRRVRCKRCEPCGRSDCEECSFCKDMKKYGGPGRMKQSCMARQCMMPELPNSAVCALCNTDERDEEAESGCVTQLMECGICWEIVHPECLAKNLPEEVQEEGKMSEDLPNSWECPKCRHAGKQGSLKPRLMKSYIKKLDRTSASSSDDEIRTDDDAPRQDRPPGMRDKGDSSDTSQTGFGRPRGRPMKNRGEESKGTPTKKLKRDDEGEGQGDGRGQRHYSSWQRDRRSSYSSTEDDTEDEEMDDETEEDERKKKGDRSSVDPSEGLKIPSQKYVVRPAPIPAPPKYVETVDGQNHDLPYEGWMNVFRYLPHQDLCACMRVCRVWNRWCIDRHLWANINLSRRRITKDHLVGVVRRQPQSLDLSFCNISRRQLEWLVSRLPQLRHLNLAGNSWAAVSALCSSSCPLLFSLDLRWVQGIRDPCMRDLLNPPTDHRPGVDDTRSRLYRLQSLLLAGSDVSDASVKVIVQQLNRLVRLDLSYCTMVSDASISTLTSENSPLRHTLAELDLTGCNQFSQNSLQSLAKFPNLQRVFLKNCPHLSSEMFKQFARDNPRFSVFEDFCLEAKQ